MLRCSYCRRSITGRYTRWEDGTLCCAACRASLPSCSGCAMPAPRARQVGAHNLCQRCDQRLPTCALCHERITGDYVEYQKRGAVCRRCREALPPCERCSMPVQRAPKGFFQRLLGADLPDVVLCPDCELEVRRCAACSTPLLQRYVRFEGQRGRAYCEACANNRDQCDFCGLPLSTAPRRFTDGRQSCADCTASAITSRPQLRPEIKRAREFLSRELRMALPPGRLCPVALVSAAELARRVGREFVASGGFDPRERGLFHSVVRRTLRGDEVMSEQHTLKIFVEDGLPRLDCYGVLVHEHVHLWQHDHFPRDGVDSRWREGLAVWAQHRALVAAGADSAAGRIERSRDPIYGGGFRAVLALERRHGVRGTVDAVRAKVGG